MSKRNYRFHPYFREKYGAASSEESSSSREKYSSFTDSRSSNSNEQLIPFECSPSLPSQLKPIKFGWLQSAKKCGVQWQIPLSIESRQNMKHVLKIYHIFGYNEELIITKIFKPNESDFQWDCMAGEKYRVEMLLEDNETLVAAGTIVLKARFSMAEMHELFTKARNFVVMGSKQQKFDVLYRCKPRPYWDQISEKYKGVMYKYLKDSNGQAASPINGELYGLFFSAKTMPDGTLPPTSPFGDVRLVVPAQRILDPDVVNFYFCDFYCNSFVHYVTVVVCSKGSGEDKYLKGTCILLNPRNPFFHVIKYRYNNGGNFKYEFSVNSRLWVEFYFTESFHTSYGKFTQVETKGIGSSRPTGLMHNMTCKECNLYPKEKTEDESEKAKKENKDEGEL